MARTALNQEELKRAVVMGRVESGELTLKQASELIGRSYRQAKRIWARAGHVDGRQQAVEMMDGGKPPSGLPPSLENAARFPRFHRTTTVVAEGTFLKS